MRTVVIIIIILSVIAASIFGYVLIRYIQGKASPAEETTEPEPPDTTVEEEEEPETTTEEPEEEEEPDPDKIAVIEVYLDGNRKSGIFLGEAEYGLTSEQARMVYGENLSETGYGLSIDNEDYTFVPGSTHYLYIYALIPKYGWNYTREKIKIDGEENLDANIRLSLDSPKEDEVITEANKSNA